MDTITTTLKREPFADIVNGFKHIEYREIKKWRIVEYSGGSSRMQRCAEGIALAQAYLQVEDQVSYDLQGRNAKLAFRGSR